MGEILRDRYELLETVGAGGEGTVVRGVDLVHDRPVALKVRAATTSGRREDLLAEARVLLTVPPHPNLPLVREDFFDGDRYVIAMDWVDGTDLATLLRTEGRPGLPVPRVLHWLAEAAAALTHLHTRTPPVIHGDVKPANLILSTDGRLVLVDFGLSSTPGISGRRGGTRGFVAPELAAGAQPDRASDVYALAATAWALLIGAPPSGILPDRSGIAPDDADKLESAVRAGLATDPARRPATPGELVEGIRAGWSTSLPTGVLTFLLTDIVGSTDRWAADARAMARGLVRHDDVIAGVVQEHGGRLLKSMGEGDSTVSVFAGAGDAVEAAIAVQRRLAVEDWPGEGPLRVRAGVHTGEAERRGDDYFGITLSVAARIRGLARAGEVLLSGATAAVVRPALPDGADLVDLGEHRLAGVAAPVPVFAVGAAGVAVPPPASDCPYRGLLAFEAADRDRFFGRESVVADVATRVGFGGLVAVVGSSGSGKSSLLRAGVVPLFPDARVLRPTSSVVADLGCEHVLAVDQFEEVFTALDDDQRAAFIAAVLDRPGPVVLAMRADLYGRCAEHPSLAAAVAANQVLLGPMDESELRQAIVGPAESAGLTVEATLVDLLVEEVAGEAASLPLLSHALLGTWEQRTGRELTVEAYRATGGVRQAIASTADGVLAGLEADQRDLARHVLLQLVEPGEDGTDSRRRTALDELVPAGAEPDRVHSVLSALAAARLVTLGPTSAELSHEALLRAWPQLRRWIADQRDDLRALVRLRASAVVWDRGGRDDADLYRGARLAATLVWADATSISLGATEVAFLDACRRREEAELDEARARADRQRRANRRLRVLLSTTGMLLVVAVVAGGLAFQQRGRADDEAADALAAARTADLERLLSESRSEHELHRELAMLLALEADRLGPGQATRSNLFAALQADPGFLGYFRRPTGEPTFTDVAVLPGGRVVVGDDAGRLHLFDGDTNEQLGEPGEVGVAAVTDLAVDAVGTVVAVSVSGQAALYLVAAGGLGERPPEVRTIVLASEPYQLAFGPGSTVAAGLEDGSVAVVDAETATVRGIIDGATSGALGPATVDYAPDGRLAVGTSDGVRMYADPGAAPVAVVGAGGAGADRVVAFSRDGGRVLTGTWQEDTLRSLADPARDLMLWDVVTGAALWSQPVADLCAGAVIVDDAVLCSTGAGRVVAFDGPTGRALGPRYDLHHGGGRDLVVDDSGGTLLAVAASSPVVGRWSLDGRSPIAPIVGGPGFHPLNFSPDGRMVLVEATAGPSGAFGAGPVELWDVASAERLERLPLVAGVFTGDGQIAGIAEDLAPVLRSPVSGAQRPLGPVHSLQITAVSFGSRTRFAVAYNDGVVEQFDLATGGRVGGPIDVGTGVDSVAYVRDGSVIAVAHDEIVELFDSDSGEDVGHPLQGHAVMATPDGRSVVTSTVAGAVTIHDPVTLEPRGDRILGPSADVNNLVVTADGSTLLVASWDMTVRVIDVASRQTVGTPMAMTVAAGSLHIGATLAPDGGTLAVAGPSGVRLWDLDPARWREVACLLAGRNLTGEEWERHMPAGEPYHATCPQWPGG